MPLAMDPSPAPASAPRCLNCEAPVDGNYCSACGQRNIDIRRPLLALLRELLAETFELDGRLRRTLTPFLLRPGFLSREFREGRRVRFTSPLRLYIATSLLCFSMISLHECVAEPEPGASLVVFDPGEGRDATPDDPLPAGSDRIVEQLEAFSKLPPAESRKRIVAGLTSHMPKALLLLVPVFAGIVGLLTRRRGHLYVDHLVFALHVHSLWFLGLAIAVVIPAPFDILLRLAMVVYALVAFKRAYELKWFSAVWRAAIGGLLYGIAVLVALSGVVVATMVLG